MGISKYYITIIGLKLGIFIIGGKVGNQQRELKLSRSVTSSDRIKEGVD